MKDYDGFLGVEPPAFLREKPESLQVPLRGINQLLLTNL